MHEAQLAAGRVLARVLAGRNLDVELGRENAAQRALVQDLSYGVLRHLGALDAMLAVLLAKPLKDESLRMLLRVALYQLAHTRAAPHAVVDHAVRACTALNAPAAKGLVNAVLRNYLRQRVSIDSAARRDEVARYSYPQWWIDKVRQQWPQQFAHILEAGNQHAPMSLRVNVRRTTREAYLQRLAMLGIAAQPLDAAAVVLAKPMRAHDLPGFADGDVSVQDASAQIAAPLLDAHEGMRVLDACAAPGGKSAHLLETARVRLTALDNDAARLQRVRDNLARLGLQAQVTCGDAAAPAAWWDGTPYDRILADVPCSASGVTRRHPDIKWLRRESDIAQWAARQSLMVDALWRLLAPGGKFLYVTCSVFREENHLQVARFIERHPDAQREPLPAHLIAADLAGQILPDAMHDGFFYALLTRR
jgi:16S rRNA (cytosine967-C5)-methyltransferase